MQHECYSCHTSTVKKLIEKFKPLSNSANELLNETQILLKENANTDNPYLAAKIHRLVRKKLNNPDPYSEEKMFTNNLILSEYENWKMYIEKSSNPLLCSAKLAIAGNVIDYGAKSVNGNITDLIKNNLEKPLAIDDSEELFEQIKKAKNVLYLGDNSGEIVFDRIFIETIKHPDVFFVVRGEPVINDVTFQDAVQTGMNNICKIISNGYDAPSTLLEYCSDEFLEIFYKADLVISKGMGNFEGLYTNKEKNIYFLLMAKCKPIANMLKVNIGDLVITGKKYYEKSF
ncbi:MAG: DUF89 family protein [Ignavibacteria bacterium]|nr:DUF89 family protein [Ignavibacteria bacterium]